MTAFVLDNSVSMRWCFKSTNSAYADSILKRILAGSEAIAPVLWLYEVAAVLARAEKELSLSADEARDFITDLYQYQNS